MTDTPEIERIRSKLEAGPTPGPWENAVSIFDNDGMPESVVQALNGSASVAVTFALEFGPNNPNMRVANADYIAACNPAAMAAVLAHIDAQKDEIERLKGCCAALQNTEAAADAMAQVAEKYAHKLALDLECVLADYSGKWWDTAMQTISGYRSEMNAIHERESPTFMGEPVIDDNTRTV
jgi:hypothetical protein